MGARLLPMRHTPAPLQARPLPVIFSEAMVAPSAGLYSPSASKPSLVVADWQRAGIVLDLQAPEPASREELALAHDRRYVDAVLDLEAANGFGSRSAEIAASLPWTTGAMLTGARRALREGGAVAAPCSGFHHAGWFRGSGFCTFNGLVVTARALLEEGSAQRVGILDCDQHYGDGTDEILSRLGLGDAVRHFTAGEHFGRPSQWPEFVAALDEQFETMADCDVVLYQAGADPHIDDPLGGWLTLEQLRLRDGQVFEGFARRGVPLVWNLAGGYQRDAEGGISPVLAVHRHTALEHRRVFCAVAES